MRKLELNEIHDIELSIADELELICQEHALACYLGYGSLIGAMRHKGFIPWDDDMDFIMPRADYELLVAHFNEWRHSERYKLTFCANGDSISPFAKIIDTHTYVKERYVKKNITSHLWVDVFPLDDIPVNPKRVFFAIRALSLLRVLSYSDPNDGTTLPRKVFKRMVSPFFKRWDAATIATRMDRVAKECGKSAENSYIDIVAMEDPAIKLPKEWFKPMYATFENRTYRIFEGYDEYLTLIYGDWRTEPSPEQRHNHLAEAYVRQ